MAHRCKKKKDKYRGARFATLGKKANFRGPNSQVKERANGNGLGGDRLFARRRGRVKSKF